MKDINILIAEKFKDKDFEKKYHRTAAFYNLADELLLLRKKRGVTQKELAEIAGTTQAVVSRLESASVNPSIDTVLNLTEALDAVLDFRLTPIEEIRQKAEATVETIIETNLKHDYEKPITTTELEMAFERLCQAAGLVVPEGTDSETTFSNWIDLEVGQIAHSINTENIISAKKILIPIVFLFRTHGKKSSFLTSMAELIAQMGEVIEGTDKSEMSKKVSFDVNNYINESYKDLFNVAVTDQRQEQKPSAPLKQFREKPKEPYMEYLEAVKGEPYGRH